MFLTFCGIATGIDAFDIDIESFDELFKLYIEAVHIIKIDECAQHKELLLLFADARKSTSLMKGPKYKVIIDHITQTYPSIKK